MLGHVPIVVISMLILGCGSKTASNNIVPASSGQQEDLGLAELRRTLESTVLENYEQLTYGNIEAFADGVATEQDLQVAGVTPSDLLVGRSPAKLRKDRRLFKQRQPRILSKNLEVHLSKDGSVGWVSDEASYRVDFEGREASIPIRSTAVYVRDVDRWVMAAEHLSYGVPIADVLRLAAGGELHAMPPLKTSFGGSRKRTAPLLGLVGSFINIGGAEVLAATDTLVLLPGQEQEFRDGEALALAQIFGDRSTAALREFRIQFAKSKRVAWILASLAIRTERNGDTVEVPLRASFVLEREGQGDWGIVQAHVSAPLLESQISERVFGVGSDSEPRLDVPTNP